MLTFVVLSFVAENVVYHANYYIYPAGSDSNFGTLTETFGSITKSQSAASSGEIPFFNFFNITTSKCVAEFCISRGVTNITFSMIKVTGVPVSSQKQFRTISNMN